MKAPARVWRDAFNGLLAYNDTEQLSEIRAPTLLLWGDRDSIFQISEEQEQLAVMIPNARLKIYPETGHCPNWERPEQVAADIVNFMKATLGENSEP
jgi:pimeloyl-ACP methyl ester carboxylesterase